MCIRDRFEYRRLITNLSVTGTNAPKSDIVEVFTADEKIAIGINIRRSMDDAMGDIDRALPTHAAVRRTAKFSGRAGKEVRPKLVLKAVTRPGGPINRK